MTAEPAAVRIDQRVLTLAVPVDYSDDGTPLLSYAFEPAGEAG